jgi:precorrin-2 dehydrogenase/sirohydrochlorin ferrochelatase
VSDGYPVVLSIEGRRCVVVGGGRVAARKLGPLIWAGARVTVVAPVVDPAIERAATTGTVQVERRDFEPADLDGAFLAIAATDRPDVNRAVVDAAHTRGVLVNVADDPTACDFAVPATVRRRNVTLAVSTGGRSPAFSRFLRQELESWLTEERCQVLELAAEIRRDLKGTPSQPSGAAWQRALADDGVPRALAEGDRAGARQRLLTILAADE